MKIYLVTNRNITKGNYMDKIEVACKSGVDRIILREKDLDFYEYLILAKKIKFITDSYNIPLILNGNIEVAKNINSFAYHCSYNEFIDLGRLYSITGVSIHSLEEAINVEKLGADYILAGHIFETDSKKGLEPRGIKFLENLREKIEIPIIAIGGISPENIEKIYATKVDGIAVMSYIMSSHDGCLATKKLKDVIRRYEDV